MKDEFYETSSAPQNLKVQKFFYVLYTIFFWGSIVISVVFLWFLMLDWGFLILLVFSAGFAVLCYFIRRKTLLYFDYTYISGEVRIVRVINGKFRRRFLVIYCKDIEQVGKVTSNSFERLYENKAYKRRIATPNGLGADNQLYYIAGKVDGERQLIVLECDEQFLAYIVSYRGKGILESDYE